MYIAKLEPKRNSSVRGMVTGRIASKSSFAKQKKSGFAAKVLKSEQYKASVISTVVK